VDEYRLGTAIDNATSTPLGQTCPHEKVFASGHATEDAFDGSVAFDAVTALIGAQQDDDHGSGLGSVYVFTRTGGIWTQQDKLVAGDGAADDRFGISVSVDDDTALIGADQHDDKGDNSGAVYVFTRTGSSGIQRSKLTAPDGAEGDSFGASVALNNHLALIGAHGDDDSGSDSGSAHVIPPLR
jgi:hypothetical protein